MELERLDFKEQHNFGTFSSPVYTWKDFSVRSNDFILEGLY